MKGWLYVISNRAVKGMVKVGGTPKDPAAYAKSLDKAGLPFPHEVGYEALVADIAAAEKIAAEALAHKAEGRGWYSCTVAEAAREITAAVAGTIILESRYDGQTKVDKLYDEVTSQDPARRIAVLSDSGCRRTSCDLRSNAKRMKRSFWRCWRIPRAKRLVRDWPILPKGFRTTMQS